MNRNLVSKLGCPARDCGSAGLRVEARVIETIAYRRWAVEEVREGAILCPGCGRSYPIEDYVPSFEQLFPPDLLEEARYWSDWYGFFWDRGYRGFGDLRAPAIPYIARGIEVPNPNSLSGIDLPGTHQELADHQLVREAETILDVGCGCGWSSLYLARRGHHVVAFDPSAGNVRRAKLYAISQGEYVEYLAAGLGFLGFEPGVFDGVFALHSIHHVPDLRGETAILRGWLRDGGVIAVDEHIQSDITLSTIPVELEKRFGKERAGRYTTLSAEELAGLPETHHSRMEDMGSAEVLDALAGNFSIESFSSRFVSLDLFSFVCYLWDDCDIEAYHRAGEMVHQMYKRRKQSYPGRVEYVTVLGRKANGPGPAMSELCRTKDLIARQGSGSQVLAELERAMSPQGMTESEWLGLELAASAETIRRLQSDNDIAAAAIEELQATVGRLTATIEELRATVRRLAAATAIDELRATVTSLNNRIHAKDDHIARLEGAIARLEGEIAAKQAALHRQANLLRRIESGRLMRLVNRLTGNKGQGTRDKGQGPRRKVSSPPPAYAHTPHPSPLAHRPWSILRKLRTRRLLSVVRRPVH